jgi:NADPH:quinone reductase-like Zn-dependent oxidoreductase
MRAVELRAFGVDQLTVVERPDPEPGPGQVLVRMRCASLNYRDQVVIAGGYGSQMRTPLVPLSDGAGEVVAVGPGVRELRVGQRVLTCFFQDWPAGPPTAAALRTSLGGPLDGTLRELGCFPERGLLPVPDHLGWDEAAALPCAAVTAWNALAVLATTGPADTVLVQGTGGVSLFALQFAKLMGARVIATSSSDEKLERVRALGADHALNYARTPEWGKAARELTGGRGVDHVIEVGGAGTLPQSLRAVGPGGTISLIGVLAGARNELHLPHVFLPQVRLQGVVVGSRAAAADMLRAIAAHGLRPVLDARRFTIDDMGAALAHMAAGKHFGKIAIAVAGAP